VNIFINEPEEVNSRIRNAGELNVMIAEKESRKKGLATEALILAMDYAIHIGKTNAFVAKINDINEPSKQLFEKLGFILTEDVNYFKQVTYELEIENEYQNNQYKQWKVLCDRNH